jgi:hypothetical protein
MPSSFFITVMAQRHKFLGHQREACARQPFVAVVFALTIV